jgi:V/A-type H+-transporting ATPase subunit I
VIVSMQKVRIFGPRDRLASVIGLLQDVGVVHLCAPPLDPPLAAVEPTARQARHVGHVESALGDVEEALARLEGASAAAAPPAQTRVEELAREVRLARRARRAAVALSAERRVLEEERDRLLHMVRVLEAFADLGLDRSGAATRTFFLVLSRDTSRGVERLQRALSEAIGDSYALQTRPIRSGELGLALTVPEAGASRIEALLPEVGVGELELPEDCAALDPSEGVALLRRRLAGLDEQLVDAAARLRRLADWLLPGLLRARAALNDWLLANRAMATAAVTSSLFVLQGWLPAGDRPALEQALADTDGGRIFIEEVARETWSTRDVPVAIANPGIFRPFELITRRLPLPQYGTMDPTPFVAVFFPMFFGLILGDLGYGAVLALLALVGWVRSRRGGVMRSISQIAAACAAFSMLFGLVFGEFFGDLGHELFGLHAVALQREEAFIPFLVLALALGFVHMMLGLILGALSSLRSDPRQSLGRGLAAVMLLLSAALLLVAVNVLPRAFFTPAVVGLLLAFPLLIAIEGVIGPIELLSRLSNILSYARIMALGTASVMLAMVANRMVGTLGGVVVGVVFATLFHVVNFALGVFSPTIHSLRLHFVEFFGTFYSPGGLVYRPFRHWRPAERAAPQAT